MELNSRDSLCHMYPIRGLFSLLRYHFFKTFSADWQEVILRAGQLAEKILIKTVDAHLLPPD